MGCIFFSIFLFCALLGDVIVNSQDTTSVTLVPAIITFGDSAVDIGNNDYIPTLFKANYPPYGRDFANHKATGRFCNGKLATDITGNLLPYMHQILLLIHHLTVLNLRIYAAETLGFTTYPPAYLSPQASGKNLLMGANFASAASGYDDKTAFLSVTFHLLIFSVVKCGGFQ